MRSLGLPREAKVSSSEKMRIGGSDEVAWIQICEPTEKDKGKYTFELFDGKEAHKRTLDLSGQGRNLYHPCNILALSNIFWKLPYFSLVYS